MTAAVSLIIVLFFSFLIVRIGTIALTMTGLSEEVASFQSLSAFSGAGFTTNEAENVLVSQARRKIIKTLIRLGSVGVVTAISSLFLSFAAVETALGFRVLVIIAGVIGLFALSKSEWLQRATTPMIRHLLKSSGAVNIHDYASLLHLREGYSISEIKVVENSWFSGGTLRELRPTDEGMLVLGIAKHNGEYVGTPKPEESFEIGDVLLVYGRSDRLIEISERSQADQTQHEVAMKDQAKQEKQERSQ